MQVSNSTSDHSTVKVIYRITLLGAILNLILVVLKFIAGFWGNSSVLVADAVHSLSDFVTDFVLIFGAKYWGRPADENHPYGHAKLETIVTLFIGAALLVVGGRLILGAISTLHSMIFDASYQHQIPGSIALIAAIISIFVKEYLYRVTARVAREVHSSAVAANAWHHRSDALSSIPAALAVGCCIVWGEKYAFLDPVATVLVGGMVLYAAWTIIFPTFGTLMDEGASLETIQKISSLVKATPGVSNPHHIRTRSMGQGFDVDLHVWVNGSMTVLESHELAHSIEKTLKQSPDLKILDVIIHIEPEGETGEN